MHSVISRELGWQTMLALVAVAITSIPAFAQETPSLAFRGTFPGCSRRWQAPIPSSVPPLGHLAGYLHFFDRKSRPSIFAVSGQYSTTDSIVAGLYAGLPSLRTINERSLRWRMANIKNDYDDYLGTGVPLRNEAELRSFVARYTYRVTGNWFLGGQGIYQNFAIAGQTPFDDQVLDILGVQPYKSAGAGLVVQNDSRDDENMPTRGWLLNLNNMALSRVLGRGQ